MRKLSHPFLIAIVAIWVGSSFLNSGLPCDGNINSNSTLNNEFNHPRVLANFLRSSDIQFFKRKFQELVITEWERREAIALDMGRPKPRRHLEYFALLKDYHLKGASDKQFQKVINHIHGRVQEQFGPGYVMVNDFWSWRTFTNIPAERAHMDADFWMTGKYDGFNLWILLDHDDMPYAFDIFTKEKNKELYKHVKTPHYSTWLIPEKNPEKTKDCPGIVFFDPIRKWPVLFELDNSFTRPIGTLISIFSMKWWMKSQRFAIYLKKNMPDAVFRFYMATTGMFTRLSALPSEVTLESTRFPMNIGDALVVRQQEIHGTDQDQLKSNQFRLAIGFKFIRRGTVKCYSYTSPASKSRRSYPGLRMPLGTELKEVYRTSDAIDMTGFEDPEWMKMLMNAQHTRFTPDVPSSPNFTNS